MSPPLRTGAEVIAAVTAAAAAQSIPVKTFIAPITSAPGRWLHDVGNAGIPREVTLARVRALLAGDPIPSRQSYIRSNDHVGRTERCGNVGSAGPLAQMVRVDRDPCPRCAVRGDIGCRHRPWTLEHRNGL